MTHIHLRVTGEWVRPMSAEVVEVEYPATELILGEVPAECLAMRYKPLPSIVIAPTFFGEWRYPPTQGHRAEGLPNPQPWRYLVDVDVHSPSAGSSRQSL